MSNKSFDEKKSEMLNVFENLSFNIIEAFCDQSGTTLAQAKIELENSLIAEHRQHENQIQGLTFQYEAALRFENEKYKTRVTSLKNIIIILNNRFYKNFKE